MVASRYVPTYVWPYTDNVRTCMLPCAQGTVGICETTGRRIGPYRTLPPGRRRPANPKLPLRLDPLPPFIHPRTDTVKLASYPQFFPLIINKTIIHQLRTHKGSNR